MLNNFYGSFGFYKNIRVCYFLNYITFVPLLRVVRVEKTDFNLLLISCLIRIFF